MSIGYFGNFPTVFYDLNGVKSQIDYSRVTNIISRINFIKDLKLRSDLYYSYVINESDTPENIAARYYGDPNYFWVVLAFNTIMDPQFDWPLNSVSLDSFIREKYGESSINDVHHYELRVETYDVTSQTTTNFQYTIDETTYQNTAVYENENFDNLSVTTTTNVVTNYDYEIGINESKRTINIMKKEYLGQIQNELEKALSR